MFCFQCEQTAQGKGCTIQGVCGKKADTADLQDELTSALIELANCSEITDENTELLIDGLFITITNVNFDNDSIKKFTDKVRQHLIVRLMICRFHLFCPGMNRKPYAFCCHFCIWALKISDSGLLCRHFYRLMC